MVGSVLQTGECGCTQPTRRTGVSSRSVTWPTIVAAISPRTRKRSIKADTRSMGAASNNPPEVWGSNNAGQRGDPVSIRSSARSPWQRARLPGARLLSMPAAASSSNHERTGIAWRFNRAEQPLASSISSK